MRVVAVKDDDFSAELAAGLGRGPDGCIARDSRTVVAADFAMRKAAIYIDQLQNEIANRTDVNADLLARNSSLVIENDDTEAENARLQKTLDEVRRIVVTEKEMY